MSGEMGHTWRVWPVLLLLLLAVLLPTLGLLWFMNEAINSQRRAAEQEIAEAYRGQMSLARDGLKGVWEQSGIALDQAARERSGAALFEHCVRSGLADAVICFGEKGELTYPAAPAVPVARDKPRPPEWREAERSEERGRSAEAARIYEEIARSAVDPDLRARAWQAQARSLVRAGDGEAAVQLIVERLETPGYRAARDWQGRLISADAALLALQLMKNPSDRRRLPVARHLFRSLTDYRAGSLPAGQRLFLMREVRALGVPPEFAGFPTYEAEQLAARFMEAESKPVLDPDLRRTSLPDVWSQASPNGRVLALLRTQTVVSRSQMFLDRQMLSSGLRILISPPGGQVATANALLSAALASPLSGFSLALVTENQRSPGELSRRRTQVYVWVGFLMIVAMSVAALVAAGLLQRRLRLAQLRTDLVASVSHELRTPLASVRVLVDTLLSDTALDPGKTREYLALIAAENARLGRLIENFLAFSRIERRKYSLELASVEPGAIVADAVEAAGERFRAPDCVLEVAADPHLPRIWADSGAMVTVLVNLLDNAYKYSPGEKRIALRACSRNGAVCFEVEDHGVGIAPRERRRIFRKFYQADNRLSRSGGGCGLGLSIVEHIVRGHGGRTEVRGELGKGSVFTVTVPAES